MDRKFRESISVFFLVYNDARSIGKLVRDVRPLLERRFNDWEILLINDGSEDDSGQVVDALARSDPHIRAVHHGTNRGYGGAVSSGFAHSTGQLVFYTDGDGQYDPRELDGLLDHLDHADIVNGFKVRRRDAFVRKIEGRVYHAVSRFLFELSVRDVDCDFRLLRRRVVDDIMPFWCSGAAIGTEMLAKAREYGYHVATAPVNHYPRPHGRSQFFCARRIARCIREMFELWCLLRAGKKKKTPRRAPSATAP